MTFVACETYTTEIQAYKKTSYKTKPTTLQFDFNLLKTPWYQETVMMESGQTKSIPMRLLSARREDNIFNSIIVA